MNENREKQTMGFCTTPMNLNKWTDKKSRETNRIISDESIQECTSLNRNNVNMRNRPNTMTRYLKKQVIELSKLRKDNPRISTPTNGSTGNEWHNIINMRRLYVRIHWLLYQRYTKSKCHYLRGNDILFTLYLTLHKLNVGNISMDKKVRIKLSNQSNRRGMLNI